MSRILVGLAALFSSATADAADTWRKHEREDDYIERDFTCASATRCLESRSARIPSSAELG